MKTKKNVKQATRLTPDSENRLLAYTTAAGLGAFFCGQNAQAQVTESQCLGPYPHTMVRGDGTGYYGTYHYMDVDGDGTADFNFNVDNFRVNMGMPYNTNDFVLNPSSNGYVIPWTNGMTLDAGTSSVPTYKIWLATNIYSSGSWYYLFDNFATEGSLGFSFIAADGQTHFGYMNIIVHTAGGTKDFSATVYGVYYNATPDAGITIGAVPVDVKITDISVTAENSVTINFTSSDNAPASAFTLETSPVLGASATWTADAGAMISTNAPGAYQAVTTGTNEAAQFYRISH